MPHEDVARAIACFQASDDVAFLREVLRAIRPKAESTALRFNQQGRSVPPPEDVEPASQPASNAEAIQTVKSTKDFALLQAMSRSAGRRVEELSNSA